MSRALYDCVGFGICVLDYLCLLPEYPKLDEKTVLSHFAKQGGGPVPTALVTLSRLGAQTAYIGKVGNDSEGDFIHQELADENVNVEFLIRQDKSQTPNAFVWIERSSGKRTIVLNRTKSSELPLEQIPVSKLDAKVWLIDGWEVAGTLQVAAEAKKRGQIVIADFGSLRENIEEMLALVDYPVVSEKFARNFFGNIGMAGASKKLLKWGAKAAVVTCGNKGSYGSSREGSFYQPAFKVPVVDTTGAGDVFHGSFVYGVLKNWPLPRILRFASAVAALKCTALGGRTAIPTLKAVENFLAIDALKMENVACLCPTG